MRMKRAARYTYRRALHDAIQQHRKAVYVALTERPSYSIEGQLALFLVLESGQDVKDFLAEYLEEQADA